MTQQRKDELKLQSANVLRWLFNSLLGVSIAVISYAANVVTKTSDKVVENAQAIAVLQASDIAKEKRLDRLEGHK